MQGWQVLMDTSTGEGLELVVDLQARSLYYGDFGTTEGSTTQYFSTIAELEAAYRAFAQERFAMGWSDGERGTKRLLRFAKLQEKGPIEEELEIPADDLADVERRMTIEAIEAVVAAVRHTDLENIKYVRLGRGEFECANVRLDGETILASAVQSEEGEVAVFFDWAGDLHELWAGALSDDGHPSLYDGDRFAARVANRLGRDRPFPTDVDNRLAADVQIELCSYDDPESPESWMETALAGLDEGVSTYLAKIWS